MDSPQHRNRFSRHPLLTSLAILVFLLVVAELLSYAVVVVAGHRDRRRSYPYNRVVSGYTVFRNTPGFNAGSSTIRQSDDEPDAKLDQHGFLTDRVIEEAKPPDTIRIFLQGGSAAFGAGQNVHYHAVHDYPDGVYTYPLSIAGQLEAFLEEQLPETKFQVINAASYARVYHQSMLQYLEQISRFQPDYVISFDGWNDITTFTHGRPFDRAERMLPEFIQLDRQAHSILNRSNTFYVLRTAFDKLRVNRNRTVASSATKQRDLSETAYRDRREQFIRHAQRFVQIVRQYLGALQADGTQYIFVLQPMLPRMLHNKELSRTEEELLDNTLYASWMDRDNLLVARYFFDDYLVHRLSALFEDEFGLFIDANREIAELDSSIEIFTDYCHLTPQGNEFIAQCIGRRIVAHLQEQERR